MKFLKRPRNVSFIESTGTESNPEPAPSVSAKEELERGVVDVFVRAARLVGLPRSLGEIFGLLYIYSEPLSMEEIRRRLDISLGSASQGLRQLRAFRAVRVQYIPGERRDHFVAEPSFRRLVSGFIEEEIRPHLDSGRDRLDTMWALLGKVPAEEEPFLRRKVEQLEKLHRTGDKVLPVLVGLIKV